MEKHLNNLNSESLKVGLKIHKGKTKYMTNHADSEDILIDQQKIEKVTEFKYLGQTTHLKDTTKEEIHARIRAEWSCFEKKIRKYSKTLLQTLSKAFDRSKKTARIFFFSWKASSMSCVKRASASELSIACLC